MVLGYRLRVTLLISIEWLNETVFVSVDQCSLLEN
jgi:hypothetical protein